MSEPIEVKTEETLVDPPQVTDEIQIPVVVEKVAEKKKKVATEKQKAALAKGREKLKVFQEERRKRGEEAIKKSEQSDDTAGASGDEKPARRRTSIKPKLIRETNDEKAEEKTQKSSIRRVAEVVSRRLQSIPSFM